MTGGEWAAILTAILVGSSGWITAVLSGRVAVSKSQLEQLSGQFDELVKMFNPSQGSRTTGYPPKSKITSGA